VIEINREGVFGSCYCCKECAVVVVRLTGKLGFSLSAHLCENCVDELNEKTQEYCCRDEH